MAKGLNPDKKLQAYVIGLALGDGNLSNPNGRATRLRITCDKKYPLLIQRIFNSLHLLFPDNKVSIVNRDKNHATDISIYSNRLEKLMGWRATDGSKYLQKVSIPNWIKQNNIYKIKCLKGLIETDGSIYFDRGYKMVIFTTIIPKLGKDFYDMVKSLGFVPNKYRIKRKISSDNFYRQILYHVRLSKNVDEFLNLIKPEKK